MVVIMKVIGRRVRLSVLLSTNIDLGGRLLLRSLQAKFHLSEQTTDWKMSSLIIFAYSKRSLYIALSMGQSFGILLSFPRWRPIIRSSRFTFADLSCVGEAILLCNWTKENSQEVDSVGSATI